MIHETRMTLTGGGRLFFDFSRAAFSQLEVETEGRDGGGMLVITAWWGVWHIISGLSLALAWRKFGRKEASEE